MGRDYRKPPLHSNGRCPWCDKEVPAQPFKEVLMSSDPREPMLTMMRITIAACAALFILLFCGIAALLIAALFESASWRTIVTLALFLLCWLELTRFIFGKMKDKT